MLEFFGALIQTLWEPVADFVRRHVKATLVFTVVVAVVGAFVAGSFFKVFPWSDEDEGTLLGGVDIAGYCDSYGFESGTDKNCFSKIDLNLACDWQYSQTGMRIVFTTSSPFSGVCYTKSGKKMHGIDNMDDYCKSLYKSSSDVRGKPAGAKTWRCRTPVDMKLVCNWKWQKVDVVAREVEPGNWKCYERT